MAQRAGCEVQAQMTESKLVAEVAKRAGVSKADVKAVLDVLADVEREQRRPAKKEPAPRLSYVPSDHEIADLIAAAASHPLGIQFLLEGELCAVATTFRVHAFTVDAAREHIRAQGASLAGT